jgi:hypothetical protein
MSSGPGFSVIAIVACALMLSLPGCNGCEIDDVPISSNPSAETPDRMAFQSETSMARLDSLDANYNPKPHFVVSYNDATQAEQPAATNCWQFTGPHSLDGWSTSDDLGHTWTRHAQLAPLAGAPFHARHGDTWVATWNNPNLPYSGFLCGILGGLNCPDGSVALLVSVAQQGPGGYDGPWGLYINRMVFGPADMTIDLTKDTEVALPPGNLPDGPHVAIRGDGNAAMITWQFPAQYELVTDLHTVNFFSLQPMTFGPPKTLDPMATGAQPPDRSCTSATWAGTHPQIAAGYAHFYYGGIWRYNGCADPDPARLEVYRTTDGDQWERILSARVPPQFAAAHGLLNAQNINATPQYGSYTDRGEDGVSMAVGLGNDGDYLLLVTDQTQAGDSTLNEASRERVIQYRIPRADGCAADARNLFSCDGVQNIPFQQIDLIAKANGMQTIANRVGVWESKPHVFTGNVSDGYTVDWRVGIIWYTQPYKGLTTASPEMMARTIVEAVTSGDGGQTYSGPFNMTTGSSIEPSDSAIGTYFHPCQFLSTTACNSNGYFGEYISGVFLSQLPANLSIQGAWGDSREGCTQQGLPTIHQHVWGGTTRAK